MDRVDSVQVCVVWEEVGQVEVEVAAQPHQQARVVWPHRLNTTDPPIVMKCQAQVLSLFSVLYIVANLIVADEHHLQQHEVPLQEVRAHHLQRLLHRGLHQSRCSVARKLYILL